MTLRFASALLLVATSALASACFSHPVTLVAPEGARAGDCYAICASLFGERPTLSCGERSEPRRALLCSYDRSPSGPPAKGAPQDGCRAECAAAGLAEVEACWSVTTTGGVPTVACQYRVGAH
jgi:hypothetical protein